MKEKQNIASEKNNTYVKTIRQKFSHKRREINNKRR